MTTKPSEHRPGIGKVLVVDDEPIIRDLLQQILSRHGYDVTTALDADSGRLALSAGLFEVLIVDLHLPGIPGDALCREARELQPDLRAILISGDEIEDSERIREESGAEAVLHKPFELRTLIAALHQMHRE